MKTLISTLIMITSLTSFAKTDAKVDYSCQLKKGKKSISFSMASKYLKSNEDVSSTLIVNSANIFSKIRFSFFILRDNNASGGYMLGTKTIKKKENLSLHKDIDFLHTGTLIAIDRIENKTISFKLKNNWIYKCSFSNVEY